MYASGSTAVSLGSGTVSEWLWAFGRGEKMKRFMWVVAEAIAVSIMLTIWAVGVFCLWAIAKDIVKEVL